MKNTYKKLLIALLLSLLTGYYTVSFAQGPPAPPSGGHGQGTNQAPAPEGGSAPIGGGLAILLAMGAGYAGKKIYNARKQE